MWLLSWNKNVVRRTSVLTSYKASFLKPLPSNAWSIVHHSVSKAKVKQKLATWITVCINLCQLMLWAWVFWPNGVYRCPGNHKLLFTKYRKWVHYSKILHWNCFRGYAFTGTTSTKTNSAGKFISWMTGWSYVRSQLFLIRYHCEEAWERQKKTLCGNR